MVAKTCSTCGAESPEQFRFCGFCGSSFLSEIKPPAISAHVAHAKSSRRLVTILYADLTNYTHAAAKADLEEIFLTVRKTMERLAQAVRQLGGHVDRFVGDAIMSTFGVPEAHEDDPIRAVTAALSMQHAMQELREAASQSLGWEVQLRVGLNSGTVISGQIDTGSLLDASVFGHTVNLACRLQQSARPGTILVSETVYRQTRAHFEFTKPIQLQLRGLDQPVVGYELHGRRAEPESSRGLSGRRTPLVGRSAETEALVSGLRRCSVDRSGAMVLVSGRAGIGKTRLVNEVISPLGMHFSVVRAGCSQTQSVSYGLLVAVLEDFAGISAGDSRVVREQRIDQMLAASSVLAREIGPVLRSLVGEQVDEGRPLVDPQQQQRQVHAAVRRLFSWLAQRQGLLLVLDDVQWADPSSMEALLNAADLTREVPLALMLIARAPARDRFLAMLEEYGLLRPENFWDICLGPLSAAESDHLLSLLMQVASLPDGLRENISRRSGGNPLLIEEMVRMLLDQGVLHETAEDGWVVGEEWTRVIQQVPETVNGLILGRYDRLTAEQKHVLDAASVLGVSFSLAQLAALTGIREQDLQQQLTVLEEADFLRKSFGVGEPIIHFRHALMQEAIYQTLFQQDRRQLHTQAAEILGQTTEDLAVDNAADIGYHLEQGQSVEAVTYLKRAAESAAARDANQEAIDYYQRVRALLQKEPGSQEQAVDVALGLAEVLLRVNRLDEAQEQLGWARSASQATDVGYRWGDTCYQLAMLADKQGDQLGALAALEAASTSLAQDSSQCKVFSQSDVEREMGWNLCDQGKMAEARTRAEKALALAREQSDQAAMASTFNLLARLDYWAGDLYQAIASGREALTIREQMGDIWGAAAAQTNLGLLYHRLGQWSEAESFLRQAAYVHQEVGDRRSLVTSSNNLGLLLLEAGRFDEALEWLNKAIEVLQQQTYSPVAECELFVNRGLLWLRLGEPQHATVDLERGLLAADQSENDSMRALALAYLAESCLADGDLEQAQSLLETSKEIVQDSKAPEISAEVLRVNSLVLKVQQEWRSALVANQGAQALYQQLGNSYELARLQVNAADIQLTWYQVEQSASLDPQVRTELQDALAVLRGLNARADIQRAEDLLLRIGAVLTPIDKDELLAQERPVVVVHLKLAAPLLVEDDWEQQEVVAQTTGRLTAELNKVGRSHGAIITASGSGLTYLLSDSELENACQVALTAVASAQAARDAGLRLNQVSQRQQGLAIPLRIGVASGVWQRPINSLQDAAIFANASPLGHEAEQIALAAPEQQILLAAEMAAAVESAFKLEPFSLEEELSAPVFILGDARSRVLLPQPLPGPTVELFGRKSETSALTDWIDQAQAGATGRVCYLEAEAGMGKTRLLESILSYAQTRLTILHGKCESFRSDISYWPIIDVLEQSDYVETPASIRLKGLLALRTPSDADASLLRNLAPENLQQELLGLFLEFILRVASGSPVLLIIEDIHWLDLSSLDLLDALLPLVYQAPLSILFVARSEMPGPHRALISKAERVGRARYLQISFSSLSEDESYEMAKGILGAEELPAGLWEAVQIFAGHPLSLEEVLRFLVERNWLRRENGDWHMIEPESSAGTAIPATFKELLLGRSEALDSETLHAFQAAAVLGETFDRTVLGRTIAGVSLSDRLAELVERQWLVPADSDNPLLYRFKHTLTRETIYNTLLTSKRQLLHQRAGEAIETLYPEAIEENAEMLAYHFGRSSLWEKALSYLIRAAEKSADRCALAESLGYYHRAKELLERIGPRPRLDFRMGLGLADVHLNLGEPSKVAGHLDPLLQREQPELKIEQKAAALCRLGEAQRKLGVLPAALEYYQAAQFNLAVWKESHPAVLGPAARAAEDDFLTIELGLAQTHFDMRENTQARRCGEKILDAIDRPRQPRIAAETLGLMGGIAYRQGDLETATKMAQQSLSLHQVHGNRSGAANVYANLGVLAAIGGDLTRAHDRFVLSLEIREAGGGHHPQ